MDATYVDLTIRLSLALALGNGGDRSSMWYGHVYGGIAGVTE